MKLLVISFFESDNIGDIALSNCLVKLYQGAGYDCLTYSYSQRSTRLANVLNQSAGQGARSFLKKLIDFFHLYAIYDVHRRKYRLSEDEYNKLSAKIKEVDCVVIGGGNMVYDTEPETMRAMRLRRMIELCHELGKKCFVISVGVGPFIRSAQCRMMARTLELADGVTFRDRYSYELFKKYAITAGGIITADPALLMESPLNRFVGVKQIGINVIDAKLFCTNIDDGVILEKYARVADSLIDAGYDVTLYTTEQQDEEYLDCVLQECRNSDAISTKCIRTVDDLITLYTKVSIIVTTRMHAAIIGVAQGVIPIGLGYQPKVKAFFELMNMAELYFELRDYEPECIAMKVAEIYDHGDIIRQEMELQKNKLIEKLRNSITMIGAVDEAS